MLSLLTNRIKAWAKSLKRDVMTLWFVLKHPQAPWYARALAALLTAYALSPIDLIPDFIWLLLKIIPAQVLDECRNQADEWFSQDKQKPRSWVGLTLILSLWCLAAWLTYSTVTDFAKFRGLSTSVPLAQAV
ncbi:MAG: DUF1232 domain-containing protein [Betaproteobacteria bacterium]|nr:DUF1232 domain-containing protein [Betaproteobacteria bacterium]